jgi:bifunctional non-homologous end joining protein LigD
MLDGLMPRQFPPMLLNRSREPLSSPDWIFELKYEGFRALAVVEHGRAQLISRNCNPFASFTDLAKNIDSYIPNTKLTVLDGEIVCLDKKGRPQFKDLLYHRGDPCCTSRHRAAAHGC